MKRFWLVFALLSLNFILPRADVAQDGGDCSLIREAYANMAPPREECLDRKVGEFCYTRFEGRPGKCREVNNVKPCVADEGILPTPAASTATATNLKSTAPASK